jgi:hypothetical protein
MNQSKLNDRLDTHFATLRSSSNAGLKRGVEKWQVYAAVATSALAMTTNASAGLIYSGIQNKTVSVASVGDKSSTRHNSGLSVLLNGRSGPAFVLGVRQGNQSGTLAGGAFLGNQGVHLLTDGGLLRKLNSGAMISGGVPGFQGASRGSTVGVFDKTIFSGGGTRVFGDWVPGEDGFAGFSFETAGSATDYGWVRLVFDDSANTLPDRLTAIDWAYEQGAISIEVPSSAPEPATAALSLLAAGAAGIAALRRRRKAEGSA